MAATKSYINAVDYELLAGIIASALQKDKYKAIVDAPFNNKADMAFLFLGFICLYIVDEKKGQVQFKAASGTEEYRLAVERYNFKPSSFHLSLKTDKDNTIVQAIADGKPKDTTDWVTLSRKHKSEAAVRINQANSGIAYTAIYPFPSAVRGALMFNFYQYRDKINGEQRAFMQKYTSLVTSFLSRPEI